MDGAEWALNKNDIDCLPVCAADVCVDTCDRKSECNPGNWTSNYWLEDKCPLNVCCSKHGFCGTTDLFCGDKKVKRPSCSSENTSAGGGFSRVVGYFESWATTRPCNKFMPEDIPLGVYTHINFAFATIDPVTFEIRPGAERDVELYKSLNAIKKFDPDLKIYIALGGWTFNDPGPTATTFSDIARSEANQKAFIKSLISFMATYGFDGVDMDWEYPVADDRSGRPEDYENFPKFMSNLKAALKGTGGRGGLSITLPASYWYLQHFDIKALAKSVDFFNMMTYDFHGTWDKGNAWTGPYLLSHTNLTEVGLGLDLLWRNDINPDQVVMGLGFYGRAFTATSTACLDPWCTFESGAAALPCSHEISVALGSEILDIINEQKVTPVLDQDSASKILVYGGNQWVAYDDEETLKMKADFARSLCLNGVMVWAISQDNKDNYFSKSLAKVAGKKISSQKQTNDGTISTSTKHPQCKWTNCAEDCPSGWKSIKRSDSGARGDEQMADQEGCDGIGVHKFCCPPDSPLPTCGWYTHHNGNCDQKCPDGTIEVGSNSMYCKKNYQAACCTSDTDSMKLYGKCNWAQFPLCMNGNCDGSTELTSSSTGSGGAQCNIKEWSGPGSAAIFQKRKYCCDTSSSDTKWDQCKWYDNIGFGPSNAREGYCRSGCPSDTVRVAMDKHDFQECPGGGAKSQCCVPSFTTITKRDTEQVTEFGTALDTFLKDQAGYCNPENKENGWKVRRATQSPAASSSLSIRQDNTAETDPLLIIEEDFSDMVSDYNLGLIRIWDDKVTGYFPDLTFSKVWSWLTSDEGSWFRQNYAWDGLALGVVCSLPRIQAHMTNDEPFVCACSNAGCCPSGESACETGVLHKRAFLEGINSAKYSNADYLELEQGNGLERRVEPAPKVYEVTDPNGNAHVLLFTPLEYPSRSEFGPNDPMWQHVVTVDEIDDCGNVQVRIERRNRLIQTIIDLASEHLVELNTPGDFAVEMVQLGRIPPQFFTDTLQSEYNTGPGQSAPIMAGQAWGSNNLLVPVDRIMHALGSMGNPRNFVLVLNIINSIKNRLWQGNDPVAETNMRDLLRNLQMEEYINHIRFSIVVLLYMDDTEVRTRLTRILEDVRWEWYQAEQHHAILNPNFPIPNGNRVYELWDNWVRDRMDGMPARATAFVRRWARAGVEHMLSLTDADYAARHEAISLLNNLERKAIETSFNSPAVPRGQPRPPNQY